VLNGMQLALCLERSLHFIRLLLLILGNGVFFATHGKWTSDRIIYAILMVSNTVISVAICHVAALKLHISRKRDTSVG